MRGADTPPDTPVRGWEELARAAALEHGASEASAEQRPLLCLVLDGSPYAIPVERVREIVRPKSITPIPRVRPDVRGAMSLRGEIIQVIDLRLRLGLGPADAATESRIVVVDCGDAGAAGLLVDAVRDVLHAPSEAIGPAVAGDHPGVVSGLYARGEQFVSLIDLDRLLELEGDDA